MFKDALLENNDNSIRDNLKKCEKLKKDNDEKKYIDPAIAEEHKKKGDDLYKKNDFPGAIKEYSEGIKRDPTNKAIYSKSMLDLHKVMEFGCALKDAEKCLEIDP